MVFGIVLSKPPKTLREGLWQVLGWKMLEKRRQLIRMALVHTCVMGQALTVISQLVKTNAQIGNVRTCGKNNLILLTEMNCIENRLPSGQARTGIGCQKM